MRHFENDDDGITDEDDVDNNDVALSDVSHEQGQTCTVIIIFKSVQID